MGRTRGVADASAHMPSSWCDGLVFQSELGQLDLCFEQVQALGAPRPRVLLVGDWNVALGTTSAARSELVEAWVEAHGLRPQAPGDWTLRWRHPVSGVLSLRSVDAFLVPQEWEHGWASEVLHHAHVRSGHRPVVMRIRAQMGSLLSLKPTRPRLPGW